MSKNYTYRDSYTQHAQRILYVQRVRKLCAGQKFEFTDSSMR